MTETDLIALVFAAVLAFGIARWVVACFSALQEGDA